MGIVKLEDLPPDLRAKFEQGFKESEGKDRKWFESRGITPEGMVEADRAFKLYLADEEKRPNKRPFDKAPGFRRIFIMGYLYGKNA